MWTLQNILYISETKIYYVYTPTVQGVLYTLLVLKIENQIYIRPKKKQLYFQVEIIIIVKKNTNTNDNNNDAKP